VPFKKSLLGHRKSVAVEIMQKFADYRNARDYEGSS
jgi:hypothetical protein